MINDATQAGQSAEAPRGGPIAVASLRQVTKRFPGIVALDRVSLEFHAGEIHVLLGENGAGKSTLVSLLAGMQRPEAGEILIGGLPVVIDSPRRSMDLGIGAVFQRVLLVPSLTVIENLMLGGSWLRSLARGAARRRFDELSALLGTRIDPDAPVSGLSLGEQQQVEIMRALWRDEKLLLLDEPTSMLTPQGVADLGRMMRRLKERGVALILVTHKLLEAYEFGDRISVLRLGKVAGDIEPQRLQTMSEAERTETVIRLMFGADAGISAASEQGHEAELAILLGRKLRRAGTVDRSKPAILSVRALATVPDFAEIPLRDVSFELWAGEVLGIAGVDGNGQKHLAEVLAGQRSLRQGRLELAGSDITRGRVPERRQRGIRYVTDDRLGEGTVGTFSVATNLVLKEIGASPYWRDGISDWPLIHQSAREQILRNDIRTPSELTPVGKLSGGNVQKVLLARELDAEANVAILNKPTYGLDLHNQRLALDRIVAAAARGVAVIVISTDLDELLEISDRVGVMFQGSLAGIVENDDAAGGKVRRLMTGAAAG
ncbi:MAG TPA: ATP-binding cassette domain-containing protein [Steroidobacteraceae bacterium]|nr:ATP-binding cassette domain-containing protein [Steroidobacteraceae bacterium]